MTIVRTAYRYKRPPRKRKPNPAALTMPKIIHAKTPKPGRVLSRLNSSDQGLDDATSEPLPIVGQKSVVTSWKPATKSSIVTARNPGKRHVNAPEITSEEHKRRGDAADALFREMKRRIAEKLRK